jgi:rod shape determining protein RodA
MLIDRRMLKQFDFPLLGLALIIPLLGLVVLFSAGYDPDRLVTLVWFIPPVPSEAFARQTVFLLVGLGAMLVGMATSTTFLLRMSYVAWSLCVLLLILVDIFGVIVNGSQRWLLVPGLNIQLQPSEPTKLAIILTMARYLARHPPRPGGYGFKELIPIVMIFGIPAALILRQPDLGTAIVVGMIGLSMLLFMGVRWKVVFIVAALGLSALYPAWLSLHDYQRRRIEVLINPELDPRGSGYHINQSKIAVGSGKVFGKGYLDGTQTQLEFLPEHTTDFVFSVLAEEWGFAGCLVVLSLYFALLYRMLQIVGRSRELFSGLVVLGIAAMLFIHLAVNIGMVIGLLPVVGIPLPLFSHGGSVMLSVMFSIGLILGVDMRRFLFSKGA